MARRRDEDHFVGMWKHPVGGWEICYKKNGKKTSEYRKNKQEAENRAIYWKQTLDTPTAKEESYEHPIHYWERKLRESAEMLSASPESRSVCSAARALAAMATAGIKAAAYLPPPPQTEHSPDAAPVSVDLDKLTTKELKELMGEKS